MGVMKNVYKTLLGKPGGEIPLRRPRHRWGIILKWILGK
jgi:hypothetical protein